MIGRIILLTLVMAGAGLLGSAILVWLMAVALLKPRRMSAGRAIFNLRRLSPADLQLPFEELKYDVLDPPTGMKLRLAAWWIPAQSDRVVMLIHGYSDAKVGAIAWAPMLHELGFNILAVDLRAHGDSEGQYTTAGFFERHDLSAILDQIKIERPWETRNIVLMGVSLGAAVVAATACLRDDVAAVVMECPYAGFGEAACNQADHAGFPGRLFQRPALALAQKMSGADFSAVRPVDLIKKIPCPLLVIQATDDPFVSRADLEAIKESVAARPDKLGRSLLWRVEGVHHVLAMAEDPDLYFEKLRDFLANV